MSRAWWNETGLQARGPGSPPRKACRSWVGARFLASWKPRFPEEPGPRLQLGVVSAGTPLALCMHPCHSLLHLASACPPFVLLMRTVLPGGTGLLVWCPGCPAALALLGGLLSWDRVCSALAPPPRAAPPHREGHLEAGGGRNQRLCTFFSQAAFGTWAVHFPPV